MIIRAARIRWKDLSAVLALTAAFALCLLGGQVPSATTAAVQLAQEQTDLADYLSGLGWEISGPPVTEQVTLPEQFGAEYAGYLELQRQGGFSLEEYAGETVTRYCYTITNYPTGESGVLADLLVLDGAVIGGDLRSGQLDGFITALTARSETAGASAAEAGSSQN